MKNEVHMLWKISHTHAHTEIIIIEIGYRKFSEY